MGRRGSGADFRGLRVIVSVLGVVTYSSRFFFSFCACGAGAESPRNLTLASSGGVIIIIFGFLEFLERFLFETLNHPNTHNTSL